MTMMLLMTSMMDVGARVLGLSVKKLAIACSFGATYCLLLL